MWSPNLLIQSWRPLALLADTLGYAPGAANCSPSLISRNVDIPGADVLSVSAHPVYGFSTAAFGVNPLAAPTPVTIDFCNVTVHYSHRGSDDHINTWVWLPLSAWNGRFQGVGGGGFAGLVAFEALALAVSEGFAAAGSDLGHGLAHWSAQEWALHPASGQVDLTRLVDFFSVGVGEIAELGRAVLRQVYGTSPRASYWNGCSTGGRQGMTLAQRYPDAFDGILAGAPAMHWSRFIPAEFWPIFQMHQLNTYPSTCVLDAVNNAAVAACDALDGVADGVISAPPLCRFDPQTLVGQKVECDGVETTITREIATLVQRSWQGLDRPDGTSLWYGLAPGTSWTGIANTTCSSAEEIQQHQCTVRPFAAAMEWLRLFVLQDPDVDLNGISHADYETIFHASIVKFAAITDANHPDLYDFKRGGGKMIHWHGLVDKLIFPAGSDLYYNQVEDRDPAVQDYYRYFHAPGVDHCGLGPGAQPSGLMDALVDWVENGVAPDSLLATTVDGRFSRKLCPYPQVAVYEGSSNDPNATSASSFVCKHSYSE